MTNNSLLETADFLFRLIVIHMCPSVLL